MQMYCIFMGPDCDLQVIEEIEEMMQDSSDQQTVRNPIQSNLIHRSTGHSFEERKWQNTSLIVFLHYIYTIRMSLMMMLRFV